MLTRRSSHPRDPKKPAEVFVLIQMQEARVSIQNFGREIETTRTGVAIDLRI
jgi:hypothetical protein